MMNNASLNVRRLDRPVGFKVKSILRKLTMFEARVFEVVGIYARLSNCMPEG